MKNRLCKGTGRLLPVLMLTVALSVTGCFGGGDSSEMVDAGSQALESGDASAAYEDFQKAVSQGEDLVRAYRGEGIALINLARYDEAVTALENALACTDEKMPETIRDIRLYLASALYQTGNYTQTISVCDDILAADNSVVEAYYLKGAAYLQQDDQDQAKECFDRSVELTPQDYSLYLRIYECYEQNSLTGIGNDYLQQALSIQPESTEDQYEAGKIYFYLEQYEEARSVLVAPVEQKYVPAIQLMGEIYLAQEDYTHAELMYRSIIDEEGETPAAYNGLALCTMGYEDYDAALNYISQGLALDQEDGKQQLRFNEIVAYEKKLDFDTALVKAEAYCTLYPTDQVGKKELTFLRTRAE